MYKLAITGGIGSGKTTVSNFISDNYDSVYLFNADKESKSHLKNISDFQQNISNKDIARELELPPVKIHCSVLAEDAIKAAIKDFRKKTIQSAE